MTSLAVTGLAIGAVLTALGAAVAAQPAVLDRIRAGFPRSRLAGGILAAAALAWAGYIVYHAPLGRFEALKPGLILAVPVAFLLVFFFMDELLAPRALGALLLLVATPVLESARWHPSSARLVVVVVAYAVVVKGMALVLNPYLLRKALEWGLRRPALLRGGGLVHVALGLTLVILALAVY
jgi:hypothetical protein